MLRLNCILWLLEAMMNKSKKMYIQPVEEITVVLK